MGSQYHAFQTFQELLQRHPEHVPSLGRVGVMLLRRRKYHAPHQVLNKVLRLDQNSLTGHYQYSFLLGGLGREDESAKHVEIARRSEAGQKKAKTELYLLNPH